LIAEDLEYLHDLFNVEEKRKLLVEMRRKARERISSSSDFEDFDGGRVRRKKKNKIFSKARARNQTQQKLVAKELDPDELYNQQMGWLENNLKELQEQILTVQKEAAEQTINIKPQPESVPQTTVKIKKDSSYPSRPYKPPYINETGKENEEAKLEKKEMQSTADVKVKKKKRAKEEPAIREDDVIKNWDPSLNKRPERNFMRNKKDNFLDAEFFLNEMKEFENHVEDIAKLVGS
jgi:hypothetical protein